MIGRIVGSARKMAGPFLAASILLTSFPDSAPARGPALQKNDGSADSAVIAVAQLPTEGRATYRLIREGGPFPYEKDGSVFGNRERLLPSQKRGFYREYTVATPGLGHRGARRLVCGGPAQTPVVCYYTSDHYASFRRLIEAGN